MTDAERIERLTAVLEGSGATVNDAFGIWAQYSRLADHHVAQLAGWADLEFLIAGSTQITDASVGTIFSFPNLVDLELGNNSITSDALANCDFPEAIKVLGLYSIPLSDDVVSSVCRCTKITMLNVNHCNLSRAALTRLSALPNLHAVEALGADTTPDFSRSLSQQSSNVLFRLRDGLWRGGECLRPPFSYERS